MNKREVVRCALDHLQPPYVPWSFGFTVEAKEKLRKHYQSTDLSGIFQNHLLDLGNGIGFFDVISENLYRDVFGVVWDRSIDKDIGNVIEPVLQMPSLKGYIFPDPLDQRFFADIPEKLERFGDCFRVFQIGFSLYERAWTLRGMKNLLVDFIDHPTFVDELFNAIADYNIAQLRQACQYDIDGIYYGDDWGQQCGLQMGPKHWKRFIYPSLKRMFSAAHEMGKYVFLHSCGDVDELFPDLIEIGLNCFNPFQPEVMDVETLMHQYNGRLAFHGGLSTQRILPYGSVADVRKETQRLLKLGSQGGYIFAPAHDVEGDVPLDNMLAFIEMVQSQSGYRQ